MEEDASVACPYCGQESTLMLDTTVRQQTFTTDCEVCCRPYSVQVECSGGEILSLDVTSD